MSATSTKKKAKRVRQKAADLAPTLMLVAPDAVREIVRNVEVIARVNRSDIDSDRISPVDKAYWTFMIQRFEQGVRDSADYKFWRGVIHLTQQTRPEPKLLALIIRNIIALREKHL